MQRLEEAELYRRVALGNIVDDARAFTITLLEFPRAQIRSYSAPASARVGSIVGITVTVSNEGPVGGLVYCRIVDADTGAEVGARIETSLPAFGTYTEDFIWELVMPNKSWSLRIEAGHIE